jgi:SAM-dependent methyltransferase
MPLDSQLTTHASNYAYTSPSYPLFYDLWITHLLGPGAPESSPLITSLYPCGISTPVILDIGTDTGSILLHLPHSPNAEIWAIDYSPAMLTRAQSKLSNRKQVNWIETSATDLPEELTGRVNLAIFSAGGIGHLIQREKRKGLFKGALQSAG